MELFKKLKDKEERKKLFEAAKEKAKKASDVALTFVIKHPVVIVCAAGIAKKWIKTAAKRREDYISHQATRFWDPSARVYLYTYRPMTEYEKIQYINLRNAGYSVYGALERMRLI